MGQQDRTVELDLLGVVKDEHKPVNIWAYPAGCPVPSKSLGRVKNHGILSIFVGELKKGSEDGVAPVYIGLLQSHKLLSCLGT